MNHHQGHIKYWNNSKGYGFIARPGNDDIFVHISQLARHIAPRAGLEVVFELKQDHKGRWQAQNVELAGKGQADTPAGTAINSHQPPAGPLQRLWRLVLMIAALVLAGFILLKSITPFYSMQGANGPYTQAGAATSPVARYSSCRQPSTTAYIAADSARWSLSISPRQRYLPQP